VIFARNLLADIILKQKQVAGISQAADSLVNGVSAVVGGVVDEIVDPVDTRRRL
jgi:hypothetical protein